MKGMAGALVDITLIIAVAALTYLGLCPPTAAVGIFSALAGARVVQMRGGGGSAALALLLGLAAMFYAHNHKA